MKDPYQEMMTEVMCYMLFIVAVVVMLVLHGCTKVDKVVDISLPQKPAQSCPKLVMPPIAEDCYLDIKGDTVVSNDCGDTLLRGYARARSLLR
jgi:hypothetical protein